MVTAYEVNYFLNRQTKMVDQKMNETKQLDYSF